MTKFAQRAMYAATSPSDRELIARTQSKLPGGTTPITNPGSQLTQEYIKTAQAKAGFNQNAETAKKAEVTRSTAYQTATNADLNTSENRARRLQLAYIEGILEAQPNVSNSAVATLGSIITANENARLSNLQAQRTNPGMSLA